VPGYLMNPGSDAGIFYEWKRGMDNVRVTTAVLFRYKNLSII